MRLLVAVLAAAVLVAPASASESRPTLAELEGELICPTCNTTLDQSNAPIAERMRQFIRARIAAGDSKSEIKDKLVADFGPAVLAAPPAEGFGLLAWLLPLGAVAVGAAGVAALAWHWSRSRGRDGAEVVAAPARSRIEPELERRLDEELARFE